MSSLMSGSGHKCDLKERLAALASEIASQEDDVRHPIVTKSLKTVQKRSPLKGVFRDSLDTLDMLPVSSQKARWEQLMTGKTPTENSHRPKPSRAPVSSAHTVRASNACSKQVAPTSARPPDVMRSNMNPGERERLERLAELEELRRMRRLNAYPPVLGSDTSTHDRLSPPTSARLSTQPDDYPLPPPPPFPSDPSPVTAELSPIEVTTPVVLSQTNTNFDVPELSQQLSTEESHTLPEFTPEEKQQIASPPNNRDISDGETEEHCNVFQHTYYSRPKFGAKRILVDESVSIDRIPRQRSVTFEPLPGMAPGDTASEATLDSDFDTTSCGSRVSDSYGYSASVSQKNSVAYSSADVSPPPQDYEFEQDVYNKDMDSDLSEVLDNTLEEAAAEYSHTTSNKENKPFLISSECESEEYDKEELDVCSDPELLTSDDHEGRPLVRTESSGRGGLIVGHRGANSFRRTPSRQRRIATIADALLDDDQPTPTRPAVRRYEELSPISQRRINRLAELPKLLQMERNIILQASTALRQCAQVSGPAGGDKGSHSTSKRSRFGGGSSTSSAQRRSFGLGSLAFVEINQMLVIACQRHQVLMEELAHLHNGSTVLVPPARGEPIRARLRLSAVRLGLKPFCRAGDPTSGRGYVVLSTDQLQSLEQSGSLLPSVTRFHLLAMLKCRNEGRLYHTDMVTVVPAKEVPLGTGKPAVYVDLPADIDVVPLQPHFVISLEIYCMRVGPDDPSDTLTFDSPPFLETRSGPNTPVTSWTGRTTVAPPVSSASASVGSKRKARALVSSYREHPLNSWFACLPLINLISPCGLDKSSVSIHRKLAAFTLLSSVDIRYHDDLLLGHLRSEEQNNTICNLSPTKPDQLPLRMLRLPRSTPLTGTAGLINAAVRLEARLLTRGFLTMFEEIGGFGVWRRYWCHLRADHLRYWSYPEDEARGAAALGRIDLRHIATPNAIPAPAFICVRANTIFMRSLRALEPGRLSASVAASSTCEATECSESILFRASPDYSWLEQRHLLCADSPEERDTWIQWLNMCLNALKDWMPEHFSCLSNYDARLEFSQPVSSQLSELLIRGDQCH